MIATDPHCPQIYYTIGCLILAKTTLCTSRTYIMLSRKGKKQLHEGTRRLCCSAVRLVLPLLRVTPRSRPSRQRFGPAQAFPALVPTSPVTRLAVRKPCPWTKDQALDFVRERKGNTNTVSGYRLHNKAFPGRACFDHPRSPSLVLTRPILPQITPLACEARAKGRVRCRWRSGAEGRQRVETGIVRKLSLIHI